MDFAACFPSLDWPHSTLEKVAIPGRPRVEFRLSGSVAVALAGCVAEAFEGLTTVALATKHSNTAAAEMGLTFIYGRLDAINETLLAVIGEQEESTHGSQRAC